MTYKIALTGEAKRVLLSVDGKTRAVIARKIEGLKQSPEKQGKALSGELLGYRSIAAAGRYRLVYQVRESEIIVIIIALGIRKEGARVDVYETLKKLLRSKVFE